MGLNYNLRTDQVLPDVERNRAPDSDVDDRPGADVAIMKMDDRTKQAIRAFLDNIETMSDTQIFVMGAAFAESAPGRDR